MRQLPLEAIAANAARRLRGIEPKFVAIFEETQQTLRAYGIDTHQPESVTSACAEATDIAIHCADKHGITLGTEYYDWRILADVLSYPLDVLGQGDWHVAARWGDYVVDWTARQYDGTAAAPLVFWSPVCAWRSTPPEDASQRVLDIYAGESVEGAHLQTYVAAGLSIAKTLGTNLMCAEATRRLVSVYPELMRVRGHVFPQFDEGDPMSYPDDIPVTGLPHWWCETPDGAIVDPTRAQFPWRITYVPHDEAQPEPVGKCHYCGKYVFGDDHYYFCDDHCAQLSADGMEPEAQDG